MSNLIKEAKERLFLSELYGGYEPYELDGMAHIFRNRELGFSVQVNPVESRQGNEYFKVISGGKGYRSAQKLARISFWQAKYIEGHTNYGKDKWVLNAKEKKALVKSLKAKSDMVSADGRSRYTNWQKAIVEFNLGKNFYKEDTEANLLGTDTYNSKYLPFNLPMPNYLEL